MTPRALLKGVVVRILSLVPARLSALSILMYHSVSDSGAFFSISPRAFERQMRHLHDSGFVTIFASEVDQFMKRRELANSACVTFDDGYEDVYTNAFPILKRYGIKASIFLITSQIGGTYTGSEGRTLTLLSEEQIREMLASGLVEFMPHGHTHHKLTSLDEVEQEEEMTFSREAVQSLTGNKPNVFAYPRGRTTPAIASTVARLGFTLAVGVVPGLVHPSADRYQLPRNAVDKNVSFREFKLKLSDNLERYLAVARII